MRTVILVGSFIIADAIRIQKPSHDVVSFVSILLVCSMCMDVIEFFNKLGKNK